MTITVAKIVYKFKHKETDMAVPKRRVSHSRSAKRRTHYKATKPTISYDPTTGEAHLRHRAHWYEGNLYYKGQIIISKEEA